MKNERVIFCQDQECTRGEKDKICFAMHFLCSQNKSFLDTSIFYFGINIGFVIPKEEIRRDKLHEGIKFIFQI